MMRPLVQPISATFQPYFSRFQPISADFGHRPQLLTIP
jgi:hypothetical protein